MGSRRIVFADRDPKRDVVTAVLVPADRYSRRPVTTGVAASLWDPGSGRALPDRIIRNRSGQLILLNRPLGEAYTFRVDGSAAGYHGPFEVRFQPEGSDRRRIVWLPTRPDTPFGPGTTVVRGLVVRSAPDASSAAIEVTATPATSGDMTFTGVTDRLGGFALAVRLESPPLGDLPGPVATTIDVNPGGPPHRALVRQLRHGREHVFAEPIDLDGSNDPPFVDDGGPECVSDTRVVAAWRGPAQPDGGRGSAIP